MATTEIKPTSFYQFLFDPANPARQPDYAVNYVEVTTYENGDTVTGPERQVNSERALELGLGIVAEPLELQRRLNEVQAALDAYENDPATFWSRIKYLFTGK